MFSLVSHTGISSKIMMKFSNNYRLQLLQALSPIVCADQTCSSASLKGAPGSNKSVSSSKGGGSKHQITYKPYVPPCYKDHDHKNMSLKRPMSPHLTVYAPTFPAFTSIAQRITGSILASYALLLSGGTLFLSNGVETYVSIIQSLDMSRPTIFILKLMLGAPFCLHYFFGMRYAVWNTGRMLKIKEVYDSGKKAIIAGAVVAVLFALL